MAQFPAYTAKSIGKTPLPTITAILGPEKPQQNGREAQAIHALCSMEDTEAVEKLKAILTDAEVPAVEGATT